MYEWNYFDENEEAHPMTDANNLYDGFRAARKGSHWKAQVQRFRWNALKEIGKLQDELDATLHGSDRGYQLSPYSRFTVNERGKIRAITALSMRDRVVKHVLCDCFLIPHIRPHLIYDNGASLQGKGVGFTRDRLIAHLEKYYRENGSNDGYIMVMDFSGYYDNIDHGKAMEVICQYEPDEFARGLVKQAFDSYRIDVSELSEEEYQEAKSTKFSMVEYRKTEHPETGEKFLCKSLSVGDQTSQITAISFPTKIDQLMKTVCGMKYYARYMDDIYLIARTRVELERARAQIEQTANELKLFINPRKTKILPIRRTFTFMQYRYYLRENGHVVVRINPKTVTRMRRKLKRLKVRVDAGKTRLLKVEEMFRSWIANYSRTMSQRQTCGLIQLYRELFGDGLDAWMRARCLLPPSLQE